MSRRLLYILGALVLVVVIVAAWFILINPVRDQIAQTEDSIETEQNLLNQNLAKLAQMEETKKQAEANQARLVELSKMVPQLVEMPSLLLQIQDMAAESGIDFLLIQPGEPNAQGSYSVVPLNLTMEGTYFDLNDFIYRAEQMVAVPGRLLATKQLGLALVEDDDSSASPDLKATMELQAFVLPMAAAAPSTPAGLTPTDSGSAGSTTTTTQGG